MKKKGNKKEVMLHRNILILFLLLLGVVILLSAIQKIQTWQSRGASISQTSSSRVSKSKLGVFITDATEGARKIVEAGPRVIKVLNPNGNPGLQDIIRQYKTAYPDGIVVVRFWVPQAVQYDEGFVPEEAAEDFWSRFLLPGVSSLPVDVRSKIDYLNGTNYIENFSWNTLETPSHQEWFSRFWVKLSDLIAENGFKPNVGEFYVAGLDANHIDGIVTMLEKAKSDSGIWSYHGYTVKYTTNPAIEKDFSLHYRQFYDYIQTKYPDLSSLKMLLSEGGVDCEGRKTDGWNGSDPPEGDRLHDYCTAKDDTEAGGRKLSRGNKEDFIYWLKWYDSELQKDSYILGITLYAIGLSRGDSGELEPIAEWLAQYLKDQGSSTSDGDLTPTKKPACIPNWCVIEDSPCCFDPMCIFLGSFGYNADRCSR
ncbi:hypothetical protein HYW55_06775 [Candidatus Gottesmanbacteria bacterium]|nr:hypothetical protein [Candidatus Gottesmanbacteria bacterium]